MVQCKIFISPSQLHYMELQVNKIQQYIFAKVALHIFAHYACPLTYIFRKVDL